MNSQVIHIHLWRNFQFLISNFSIIIYTLIFPIPRKKSNFFIYIKRVDKSAPNIINRNPSTPLRYVRDDNTQEDITILCFILYIA